MLPKNFPPWQTVYRYFCDWRKDGTWARLHGALYRDTRNREERMERPSFSIVDSQSIKTQQWLVFHNCQCGQVM